MLRLRCSESDENLNSCCYFLYFWVMTLGEFGAFNCTVCRLWLMFSVEGLKVVPFIVTVHFLYLCKNCI